MTPPHGPGEPARPLPDPATVDPAVLATLLARHGWVRRGGPAARYGRWTPPDGEPGTSLLVPAGDGFDDAVELLADAVTALSRSRTPSARSILLALAVPGDELRWHREPPGPADVASWDDAERLRQAARGMLAAGAKAARTRAAYFGARLDALAGDFLDRVLVVEQGAALTAYTPAPEGRAAVTTLVRALESLRDAVDYRRVSGGPEAFENAVQAGVSRELVQSVEELVRDATAARLSVAWSPAAGIPGGFGDRRIVLDFSPGDLPALTEAAELLERIEPAVAVTVIGVVTRLKRNDPAGPGSVRLRVLGGAEVRDLKLRLPDPDYRLAAEAHLAGLPVRVSGRLERHGGFRRLTRAHGLELCGWEEGDRERLLKSLGEAGEEGGAGT
ncbi:hypothetical protein BX285_3323 [Streptomyces sp. 1114.5]|uniref:hypothetical protein n=1 Tax=unclassified Streptomyces TaxID=2593676 RepID=UPI000BD3B33D|nr:MULTISPECIES: hypothetical protein [unclassified Streptomyces]RKT18883.1 hypothetical protein BX285_3323 [Streptomyces sp. 1114.5]SOB85081.1 hypothetical protein SAMN06272789_5353 [Streptomyces sp. 1331.2]